jgi:hypothetical protein
MQTLLLYVGTDESRHEGLSHGVERIEAHFSRLWPSGWVRHGCELPFSGMHLWDVDDAECLWPSWSEDELAGVATLYVPLGYQRLIGDVPPARSPQPLARALMQAPEGILELTPPVVLARMDKREPRLDLWTDAMGIGRMFRLRTPRGWVWSNRPEAACLFAGVPARPDPMGWRYQAATDWFMGETSPIEGVGILPAATHMTVSARRAQPVISQLDPSVIFSGSGGADFEGVAQALRDTARSVTAIWPGTPSLDLTGGRDSRVVAAAFLSAGIDVRLHTHDAVPGEVEAAEHLVRLLGQDVPHDIRQVSSRRAGAKPIAAAEQVYRWHRFSGGLRPSSYLAHTPPTTLSATSTPAIGGAGGELAHGYYYPAAIQKIDALPVTERLPAYRNHLLLRLFRIAGATDEARAEAAVQIDRVLRRGLSLGLTDASLLDYFYADERLRRFGTTGERQGVISPLLTPAFVQASFALRPDQRLDAELHRGVMKHLVPLWADVPFFKPTPGAPAAGAGGTVNAKPAPPPTPFRLGMAIDADQLDEAFALPSRCAADLDHRVARELWAASRAGTSTAADELGLWRILWRDLFHDHLALALGGPAAPREAVQVPPEPIRRDRAKVNGRAGPDIGDPVRNSPRAQVKRSLRYAAGTRPGRRIRRSRLGRRLIERLRRSGRAARWMRPGAAGSGHPAGAATQTTAAPPARSAGEV